MSKLIVQVVSLSKNIFESGKYEVEFPTNPQIDQTFSLNLPIKDPALIGYIGKQQAINCVIDKEEDNYVVSVACTISIIRHMMNITTKIVESMVIVTPNDRLCESVLYYLLMPNRCDPRFVRLVRGEPIQKLNAQ